MHTVETKAVKFIKDLFPSYKKRKVFIHAAERVCIYGLNWDGGSRSQYTIVRLADMQAISLAHWGNAAPWANPHEGASFALPEGFMVVKTGHFMGKEAVLTIYANPANLTPLLESNAKSA